MRPGVALNLAIRASLLAMLAAVIRAGPDDPRYRGKGIAARFGLVCLPASLLVPALHVARGRRAGDRFAAGPTTAAAAEYPAAIDNLYLSMLALDLAGNVFDLYDRYRHFDLIPHAHGTGAITVLGAWLFRQPPAGAIGLAMVGHILLEAQEYASDVVFGFRNVRGAWDVIGDLSAGVVGSVVYAEAYERLVRRRGLEPPSPLG